MHYALLPYQSADAALNYHTSEPCWIKHSQHLIWRGHITFKQLSKLEIYESIKSYSKFCFVRNPYDRTYSAFLHHRGAICGQGLLKQELLCKSANLGFNHYVQYFLDRKNIENNILYHHFIPQHLYAFSEGVSMLEFVGHVERFDEDIKKVCLVLGLDDVRIENKKIVTTAAPPCNPGGMHWNDYKYIDKYERRAVEVVNELYAGDFEFFGYQRLNPEEFTVRIDT